MFKKILFAYDSSPDSKRAIDYVKETALKFDAEVIILNVYDVPVVVPDVQSYTYIDLERELEDFSKISTKEMINTLNNAGVKSEAIVVKGSTGRTIIETADTKQADLIIMGSRGLGGIKSVLLGSISNYVLHNAHIPVLIIK